MEQNKTLMVGIVTFIMMTVIAVLLIWQSDIFRKVSGYELTGRFQNISGLIDGSAVRYRGYGIGHVVSIKPQPEYIDVIFFLDGEIKVPKGSSVKVMFDGLVGENYLQIVPNVKEKEYLKNKDIILGKSGSDLAAFIDIGSQNLVQTEQILAGLKKIFTDESFFLEIKGIIKNLNNITRDFSNLTKKPELVSILDNADVSLERLRVVLDTLGSESSVESLSSSLENLDRFTAFMSEPKRLKQLDSILFNIESSTSHLNAFVGDDQTSPSLLSQIVRMKVDTSTHVLYDSVNEAGYFDSRIAFRRGKYGLIGGIGNTLEDHISFQHFQQSYRFSHYFQSRLGIFYNTEGVGLDIFPHKRLLFSADYFDFSRKSYRFSTGVQLYEALNVEFSYRKDKKVSDGALDMGMNLLF